jgi:hypothetical protein|tara:strand:+ start:359 stop:514 length:156 start_codon:yes stop_codon:yes gene_type:complete
MRYVILSIALLGCPKKDVKSLEDVEREERLKELLDAEDEEFESLPESEDED